MENATKALIIAGSILVAILLIAFGMRVFQSSSGTAKAGQSTMEATAITQFNSQFAGYNGKKLSASKINDLLQKVIASNAANKGKHEVKINGGNASSVTPAEHNVIINASCYDSAGYINNIELN